MTTQSLRCAIVLTASLVALGCSADAPQVQQAPRAPARIVISGAPAVTPPPESFFLKFSDGDREVARKFYAKFIDVEGLSVAASGDVADEALQRTYDIVIHMLAGRPDVLKAMADRGTRLIIIGRDQVYTDMPEYRNHNNPTYQNERVRGTGGLGVTSFGEENLLNLPLDRYDDESIGVHEFCHTIAAALGTIDPTWRGRLQTTYQNATRKGLWKNAYTGSNSGEYWAEVCQSYFDCNRVNNWNHGSIGTREQLKQYDPEGYELVRSIFNLTPETDWRYTPVQVQPSIITPPARFKIDPYYTKFTWAREFPVVGSRASDAAMLKANDIIRKIFAYRHDILKAMINDGVKLVVLGKGEHISELPEYRKLADGKGVDVLARYLEYSPEMKLLVVGEENVLADPADPMNGDSRVVRVFAKAIHSVAGTRAVDPGWDQRPGQVWQQYELRLKRIDVQFDQRIDELHKAALAAGKWKGTTAVHDRVEYWATGVTAYFDAVGQEMSPADAPHGITTREALKTYDPDLFALVHETMAYGGHVDWRFKPYRAAGK